MAKKILVDLRCPHCNRPVTGRSGVVQKMALPKKVKRCQHCKGRVAAEQYEEDYGPYYGSVELGCFAPVFVN